MADSTVYAESLIAAVARAFYEDDAIVLIDVLLRDKFLRDDADMAVRLKLQPKQLRRTLQFLQEEHIVKFQEVDDLAEGGSQASKFWYIDYHQTVHSIRLRIHHLKQRLQESELAARSSSFYLCPGYSIKRCNGRYTEEEAQSVVDYETGAFLCRECAATYENSPNPPPQETYCLQLVDNAKELQLAMDNMRRVNVQLSGKMIGNYQLRPGIYDLLQQVDSKRKGAPLSSNLPEENRALGIGSTRMEGTGRTFTQKQKKREKLHQGVGGGGGAGGGGAGGRKRTHDDLLFLKNAIGQEIAFSVEKGGGTRAQLLATNRQRRRKLMEAAASRVAATLPMPHRLYQQHHQRQQNAQLKGLADGKKKKLPKGPDFLENNIGRGDKNGQQEKLARLRTEASQQMEEEEREERDTFWNELKQVVGVKEDEAGSGAPPDDDTRKAAFQAQYKIEMNRQLKLLQLDDGGAKMPKLMEETSSGDPDEVGVAWEDG